MLGEVIDGILVLLCVVFFAFVCSDIPTSWFGDKSLLAQIIVGGSGGLLGLSVGWGIVSVGIVFRNIPEETGGQNGGR